MCLFTQARPTPLPLSKPLGASSPTTLIAQFTSGTALARLSGPFTSWHMKTLPVPRLLLDAIQLLRLMLFDPRVLLPALDAWRTSFARPSSQGRHFLPFKGGIKNLLQPSYAKGGGWLPFIGESVTLCARATRAILNHTPIGEFRQRFFPAECIQCLCGHCQVETHQHIFANCCRFAHFPLTDLVPTVKDFVKFLKEHPSAFAFPSQDRPSSEPPEPL